MQIKLNLPVTVEILGWYILVMKLILGATNGYFSGNLISNLYSPSEYGVSILNMF